ncbi:hypothetical protein K439DRAFT_1646652 [Ramaria rubella]|nr:hypothetical protein K439DRAFT_1646652 [Ramaria rubella]
MSTSKIPRIYEVIPFIDLLTSVLDNYASNKLFFPAVLLHLHYKTLYFQRQKWPESWIDTAVKLLWDQWEQNYKPTRCESSNPSGVILDPLTHWEAQKAGGSHLARMALDFLSIPATSTDTKYAFSRGGLTVSCMHHSLLNASTCATSVLASWDPLRA